MNESAASAPRWAVYAFLGLLVLPFWPHWIDFEQVRRGLLLLLTGGILLLLPRLPRVRGEAAWWAFVLFLGIAAVISIKSLQPSEALYRIAHFGSLLVVLRLGGAAPGAIATPMTVVLLLTSLLGIAQRLGIAPIGLYGTALEPVAVFGNLNVASEWTAVAAMAVAVLRTERRALQLTALALAGCYLLVNGSRSGQIATGLGIVVLLLKRRNVQALVSPGVILGGAALGLLAAMVLPAPPPPDQAAAIAMQKRASQTLEVRWEIALSCTELFRERPLFGYGPGQFQVQYPRVRSDREIELSSQDRAFASEVRTAHDDWIELLVEGGLPLVLLFALALFALQRGTRDKERLLPLFVLLLLMFARSPLGNAPAIAAALLPVASALPDDRAQLWQLWLRRALGLFLVVLGLLPIMAHSLFSPYVSAIARGAQPDATCAARAHQWMWWEPRWLQVLAQEHIALGHADAAKKAAAMAAELRPHDPQLLLLVGQTLSNDGEYAAAAQVAEHGLTIDPQNPELRVLRSIALMVEKRYDEAIAAVMVDPHPVLQAQLKNHFAALARLAARNNDPIGAARCRMEDEFLDILETLGDSSPAAGVATTEHLKLFLKETAAAGRSNVELRAYVLNGIHFLTLGEPEYAMRTGENARTLGIALPDWQRAMLGDKLKPLLEHEVWFEVLRRRGG